MKKILFIGLLLLSSCSYESRRINNIKEIYPKSEIYTLSNCCGYIVVDTTTGNVYKMENGDMFDNKITDIQYLFNTKKH